MTKSSQKPPLVQEGNSAFISLSSLKHFFSGRRETNYLNRAYQLLKAHIGIRTNPPVKADEETEGADIKDMNYGPREDSPMA